MAGKVLLLERITYTGGQINTVLSQIDEKTYIYPNTRKAKSMTIAVSLKCNFGLVVAADRLFTHAEDQSSLGAFGSYAKKIFGADGEHFAALIVGSGMKDALYSVSGNLLTRFKREETSAKFSHLLVSDYLEEELNALSAKLNNEIPSLSLLVAVSEPHLGDKVFKSDGLIVRSAGPAEVVGIGETSLVQFLLDTLYWPDMDVKEGAALAVLAIQMAKKYTPQYCGGVKGRLIADHWGGAKVDQGCRGLAGRMAAVAEACAA